MKYYLLKYSFNSSIGGYDENLDIVNITYNRSELIEYIEEYIKRNGIPNGAISNITPMKEYN